MSTLTPSQLATLALVGCDAAYVDPEIPFPFNLSDLQSYPDSAKAKDEYGFPRPLVAGFPTDPASRTLNRMEDVSAPSPTSPIVNAIDFQNWNLVRELNRGDQDRSGFNASIYKLKDANEYIVALRGTDGSDLKDWKNNLGYAVSVWKSKRSNLFGFLFNDDGTGNIPANGTVHFVGQSLGGGLAQYAAYEFAFRLGNQFDKNKITLTTFNGFGGAAGLQQIINESNLELGAEFNPKLLDGAQIAHYATRNDIVHLFGSVTLNGRKMGHINGQTYIIDFRRPDEKDPKSPLPNTDRNFPGLVEAHRIESGFYRGFDLYRTDFASTTRITPEPYAYLDIQGLQSPASLFSRLFLGKDAATNSFEAGTTIALGVASGLALGSPVAAKRLADELIESGYRSDKYGTLARFGLKALNFGAFLVNVALTFASPFTLLGRAWSSFASVFSTTDAEKNQTQAAMTTMFTPENTSVPVVSNAPDESEANEIARLDQAVGVATAKDRPDQIDVIFTDAKTRTALREMGSVMNQDNFDAEEFSARLGQSGDWQRAELAYLHEAKVKSGATAAADIQLIAALLEATRAEGERLGQFDPAFKDQTEVSLKRFNENDVAKPIANLYEEFLDKFSDANPNVFIGMNAGFARIAEYERALAHATRDRQFASIRDLLNDGLRIVKAKGEAVALQTGAGANQFIAAAFDPNGSINTVVKEGGALTLTLDLPFSTGSGGQKILMEFAGAGTEGFDVVYGSDTVTLDASGEFDLIVPEDQRSVAFSLIQRRDVDTDSDLTLSATLVDADGNPTHLTHVEANIRLDARDEQSGAPITTRDIFGDLQPVAPPQNDDLGNSVTAGPAPNRDDTLFDSTGNDHIITGGGGDNVFATRGGDDWIEAGAGNDGVDAGVGTDLVEGGGGGDLLIGNAGDDRIYAQALIETEQAIAGGAVAPDGGPGGAWLHGNEGFDILVGDSQANIFHGGDGDDVIVAGGGSDIVEADGDIRGFVAGQAAGVVFSSDPDADGSLAGTIELTGTAVRVNAAAPGDDVLHLGAGDDFALAGAGADAIFGEAGADTLFGDAGTDTLLGGDGNDQLAGDNGGSVLSYALHGGDFLDGGAGDDQLFGQGGSDALFGGEGEDQIVGDSSDVNAGDDYIDGEAGNDILIGAAGADTILGGEGDDQIEGDSASTAIAFQGADEIYGEAGNDLVRGGGGDDFIDGGEGDDLAYGDEGEDILLGGAGNDQLVGDDGEPDDELGEADFIDGGEGNDQLFGEGGADVIIGGLGEDRLQGGFGDDQLEGGADNDTLAGQGGNDTLFGNEGDDILLDGGDGDDFLDGGAGNDVVEGAAGDDTLDGGAGSDILSGGAGGDVYRFGYGSGLDELNDAGGDRIDQIVLSADVLPQDVTLGRNVQGDLTLSLSPEDRLTITGHYSDAVNRIEEIRFADGTILTATDFDAVPLPPITGTDGTDTLVGTGFPETLVGLAGDDTLNGRGGDDVLVGGDGVDQYVFNFEMGKDTFTDVGGRIALQTGLGFNDLRAAREGDDLELMIRGTATGALLFNYFVSPQDWTIEDATGALTTPQAVVEATAQREQDWVGTQRDDYRAALKAGIVSRYLSLGYSLTPEGALFALPSREVSALASWNTQTQTRTVSFFSGATTSTITTGGFTSWNSDKPFLVESTVHINEETIESDDPQILAFSGLLFTDDIQQVVARATWSGLQQDLGTISEFTHIDFIFGTEPDPFNVGQFLPIGTITTTTVFRNFSGFVTGQVSAISPGATAQGGLFPQFINASLRRRTITEHISEVIAGPGDNEISGASLIDAGDGNDTAFGGFVYGGVGDDVISGEIAIGGPGNDTVFFGVVMHGGAGDDYLEGGFGASRFLFDADDQGRDTVTDSQGLSVEELAGWYYPSIGIPEWQDRLFVEEEDDIVSVEEGIARGLLPALPQIAAHDWNTLAPLYAAGVIEVDSVEFRQDLVAIDLSLSWDEMTSYSPMSGALEAYAILDVSWGVGNLARILIPHSEDPLGTGVEEFRFDDGSVLSMQEMVAAGAPAPSFDPQFGDNVLVGTALGEAINGRAGNDAIFGQGGDDSLFGEEGNDTLTGGPGEDFAQGGLGDDTYVFSVGDGADFVSDEGGADTMRFAGGIAEGDVLVTTDPGGTLILTVATGDRVTIFDWSNETARVESVEFADGTIWDTAELISRISVTPATEFDDIISGTPVDDVIDGLGGHDQISGLGGDDVLEGSAGDDFLQGGAGSDILRGGEGADHLSDWEGNNFLDGGPGDDSISATGSDEGGGSNFILGVAGDDVINSYAAGNVIAFNPGDGHDTIHAGNSFTLSLGGGITPAALSLRQDGTDLLLAIGASDSIRLTRQFEADPQAWPQITLQMFGSVHLYDFNAVIADFQGVLIADPSLVAFPLDSILQAHETSVSETEAFGGAFAYQYGTAGTLNGVSHAAIRQVLAAPNFGTAPQIIAVPGGNQAPVLGASLADQSAAEDAAFGYAIPAGSFTDADAGDALAYSAALFDGSPLPGWLSFDGATQSFSGTPINADVGAISVKVTVTDGSDASVSDIFVLTVTNTNDAPVLANAIADQAATEDAAFNFTLPANSFTDVDAGDVLTYSASLANDESLPSWLTFDAAARTFTGMPANDDVGAFDVTVTATDIGGASAFDTFHVTVANTNDAPVLEIPIPDQTATAGTAFSFAVAADAFSDIDQGDVLTYGASLANGDPLPAWLSFNAATRSFFGTPGASDAGTFAIRTTATDLAEAAAFDDFQLMVAAGTEGVHLIGTPRDDVLTGTDFDDTLLGKRGEDRLYGRGGEDLLVGGRGHDQLFGDSGADVLYGKGGKDTLYGGVGDDLLAGGRGNDNLEGGLGNDVYVHEQRGGKDVIEEKIGEDALRFGAGIAAATARLYRQKDDLLVALAGDDGSVTVKGWFASDSKKVESIQFADGTAWDADYIRSHLSPGKPPRPRQDDDDHDHDHHHDRDEHQGKTDRKHDDDRDDRKSRPERDSMAELLEAYLAHEPRYDFEALAREFDRSSHHGEALSAREITRRWQAVERYGKGLSDERDEDARHGAGDWRGFDALSLLGGGSSGGAFGHAGSTGATRGIANLKTLQGLEEGFHRLRD